MGLFDRLRPSKKGVPPFNGSVENNAFGGTPPRITPTVVSDIFAFNPMNLVGTVSGIGARVAARPPRAPMLESSDFHTQIPSASGFVRRTKAVGFTRANESIVAQAAVDSVTHLDGVAHPSVRRKVLRG